MYMNAVESEVSGDSLDELASTWTNDPRTKVQVGRGTNFMNVNNRRR